MKWVNLNAVIIKVNMIIASFYAAWANMSDKQSY
jgi:hypothetical protein